jgi:hypothetical protein
MTELRKQWDKVHDSAAFNSRQDFEFSNIPEGERPHPNVTICACIKVASLMKSGPGSLEPHSDFGILYLCPVDDLGDLTDQDIAYLIRCGVHYDSQSDSLAMFN